MKQIVRTFTIILVLVLVGTAGFEIIEDAHPFDALYMSVITLTTVGYSEHVPLHTGGRIFVMIYLTLGLGVFLYVLTQTGEAMVRAQLTTWLGRRRMDSRLKTISGHYIICGFGRLGQPLCRELASNRMPFVVIERDEAVLGPCREAGWPILVGDATEDRTLLEAGIVRARGLATVLSSDAENLYVVLTARLLSKDLQILARATSEKEAEKLVRAGANRVVSLYQTGAMKMAQLLRNPHVGEFIEFIGQMGKQIEVTEIQVAPEAPYAGRTILETDFRKRGIMIVGIQRQNGELILPPSPSDVLSPGDYLIILGKTESVRGVLDQV